MGLSFIAGSLTVLRDVHLPAHYARNLVHQIVGSGGQHVRYPCQVGSLWRASAHFFLLKSQRTLVLAGKLVRSTGSNGVLQVRSAAAEAVKVYEKEHKLGKSHKLKVLILP